MIKIVSFFQGHPVYIHFGKKARFCRLWQYNYLCASICNAYHACCLNFCKFVYVWIYINLHLWVSSPSPPPLLLIIPARLEILSSAVRESHVSRNDERRGPPRTPRHHIAGCIWYAARSFIAQTLSRCNPSDETHGRNRGNPNQILIVITIWLD